MNRNVLIFFAALASLAALPHMACKRATGTYQCSGADFARSELPTTGACFVRVRTVLRMRAEPNAKAKITGVLPDNARVIPGERSGPVQRIRDRRGRWTKVTWNGRSGWVFGGYLNDKGREPYEMSKRRVKTPAVCEKNFHSIACVRARENIAMRNHPGLHLRRKGKLTLKLRDGKTVKLKDRRNGGESTIIHVLRAYYPSIALFYVEMSFYEGGGYLLIDAGTGRKYRLDGEPFVAPNGKRIITVDHDPHQAYGTNSLDVWAVGPNGLKRIHKKSFAGHREGGPNFAGWHENRHPRIEMFHMDGGIMGRFILMETKPGVFKQVRY